MLPSFKSLGRAPHANAFASRGLPATSVDASDHRNSFVDGGTAPPRAGPNAVPPAPIAPVGTDIANAAGRRPPNGHDCSRPPLPGWKRALDLTCCALAFPFFAILTLGATVLLWLTSPGAIFFRQERVGLRGRRFRIFKIRTMRMGADTNGHQSHFSQLIQTNSPMQKLDARGDSRLIAGGWLLRSTGLDELPQIVNIWRGEMSIVGPRPCIPYEYEQYTDEQRERFKSVPGLTGLWQVSGKNRTTFEEMIRLDREYTDRMSLALDLKIIGLTIPALCGQVADLLRSRRNLPVPDPAATLDTNSPHPIRNHIVRVDS